MKRWLPAIFAMVLALAGCQSRQGAQSWTSWWPAAAPAVEPALEGGTDVTFFVTSDTHFGAPGTLAANRRMVEVMNRMPGTPYPGPIGGRVAVPRGVLHCGDVTDLGLASQWADFEKVYGLTGTEGLLKFPVFECTGNHDRANLFHGVVETAVARRHGGLPYSWNWDAVHFVCMDLHPTVAGIAWLRGNLAAAGRSTPVVIYFHYPPVGTMSEWWSERRKDEFAQAIAGYNIVAIFTGHWHVPGHDVWRGYDVFRPGSLKINYDTFIVARITDDRLSVALYDWGMGEGSAAYLMPRWREVFTKPINGAAAPAMAGSAAPR